MIDISTIQGLEDLLVGLALHLATKDQTHTIMFRNYLKVTLRNIRKDKWYSLINVIGLTIGITGSLLIYLHISHELSYDNFHAEADRLYRVVRTTTDNQGTDYDPNVPYPMIKSLHEDFTDFEKVSLFHADDDYTLIREGEKYKIDRGVYADSNFFDLLNFPIIQGDPAKSFAQPNFIFLSQSTASSLFGTDDPIGAKVNLDNLFDLEVAGIYKDIPTNSSIQFDFAVSYPTFSEESLGGLPIDSWSITANGTAIVRIKDATTTSSVDAQMAEAMKKYFSEQDYAKRKYHLQMVTDIHYDSRWNAGAVNNTALIAVGVIGVFILFLGCVNFINLSTALAIRKSKEVGVRKTLGADRGQLLLQFLGETLLVTLVSGILSVAIAERLIPTFNNFFDTKLSINVFESIDVILFTVLIVIIVTVLAGTYPAFIMSRFNPTRALKSNIHSSTSGSLFLRKGLITFQFVISQVLVISTVIIAYQMDYFISKPLGFQKDGVISIPLPENEEQILSTFKTRLMSHKDIEKVAFGLGAPSAINTFTTGYRLASAPEESRIDIQVKPSDIDYLETYGLEILHGRWFTETDQMLTVNTFGQDSTLEQRVTYVLNEKATKSLGFSDPAEAIGQIINTGAGGKDGEVIGVVKDFHLSSLRHEIMPAVFLNYPFFYYNTGVKISFNNTQESIKHVESVFNEIFPEQIFEYQFVEDELREFYTKEQQAYNLFMIFSGLSIFISCLGLLGMISFVVAQRTKEVGVRKVLGASVNSIVMLFTKDFMTLVLLAFVIAAPLAWYFMNEWLSSFVYKIDMTITYFIIGIGISAIITFITIAYQSLGAALSNPVNALRDE